MRKSKLTQLHFYLWTKVQQVKNDLASKGKQLHFKKPKQLALYMEANRRVPQLKLRDLRNLNIEFTIGPK